MTTGQPPRTALIAAALLTVSVLPACVGIGTVGVTEMPNRRLQEVQEFRRTTLPVTADRLVAEFGQPDDKTIVEDGREHWTYDGSLCFSGIVVWVVLPVPLALPLRRQSDTFELRDGVVERVHRVVYHERHATCGLIPGYCTGFGCDTWGTRE